MAPSTNIRLQEDCDSVSQPMRNQEGTYVLGIKVGQASCSVCLPIRHLILQDRQPCFPLHLMSPSPFFKFGLVSMFPHSVFRSPWNSNLCVSSSNSLNCLLLFQRWLLVFLNLIRPKVIPSASPICWHRTAKISELETSIVLTSQTPSSDPLHITFPFLELGWNGILCSMGFSFLSSLVMVPQSREWIQPWGKPWPMGGRRWQEPHIISSLPSK